MDDVKHPQIRSKVDETTVAEAFSTAPSRVMETPSVQTTSNLTMLMRSQSFDNIPQQSNEVEADNISIDSLSEDTISVETNETSWQKISSDIKERDLFILENCLFCDIKFIVGPEQEVIPCHRAYLAKTSKIFECILFEQLSTNVTEIQVPEVSPKAFRVLLRYVYIGTLEIDDYITAWQTLEAAKKFDMPEVFITMLRDYIRDKIDILHSVKAESSFEEKSAPIWPSIQYALNYEEDDLLAVAWQVVCLNTTEMLLTDNFVTISSKVLEKLVQEDSLNCNEIDLYNACIKWSIAEATRLELEKTPLNIRAILVNIIPHIRFLTLNTHTFSSVPAQTGIFSAHEILAVVSRIPENLQAVNFSCIETVRSCVGVDTFYVCKERRLEVINYNEVIKSKYNYITETYFGSEDNLEYKNLSVLGFSIPTQVLKNNDNKQISYEEDLSVYVVRHYIKNDSSGRKAEVIGVYNVNASVPYNSNITHSFQDPYFVYSNIYYSFHVKFHKSGIYPTRCLQSELKGSNETFGRYDHVRLFLGKYCLLYFKKLPLSQVIGLCKVTRC